VAAQGLTCRSCGARELAPLLALGSIPLVNAFIDPGEVEPERRYPLAIVRCPRCTLVQITETVAPETLFRSYAYFSSYSDTFLDHARRLAEQSMRELASKEDAFVVEVASNDGYLLQYFAAAGVRSLGIEPAENVALVARERGVETISEFLNEELAAQIVFDHGVADLVIANNVLAHVPDLHGFVGGLRVLAGDRGTIVVEVPYLCDLVDRLEFDTIYHEHVSYFTVTSLAQLFEPHDLAIVSVERLPVHGGSLRLRVAAGIAPDASVERVLAEEQVWGVGCPERFADFAEKVESLRVDLRAFVRGLVSSGASVAGYGAAAKGVVLTNVCGLDSQLVQFVVDRNPHKQGKLLPGVRIPVRSPEALLDEQPDYCVLLAWNLADEIAAQQGEYRRRGGRFVVPIPVPRELDS
jgi:hypothetical protein